MSLTHTHTHTPSFPMICILGCVRCADVSSAQQNPRVTDRGKESAGGKLDQLSQQQPEE